MEQTIERRQQEKYESYKDSGFEWIGEVPEHWQIKKNKYLFEEINIRSRTGTEDLLSVSQYTGVTKRADNIEDGDLITNAESLEGYKKVAEGDMVSNIMLAWKGSLGFSDYDGIVSPSYSVYRMTNNFNSTFFHYLFRTEMFKAEFKRNSTGVIESRLRLYTDDFFSISSFYPPKEEQDHIASFLDQKTDQIDKVIAQKQRLIELLNERRQIVIHKAVTRGLNPDAPMKDSGVEWIGDVPEYWEVKRLKWSVNVISDKIISKNSPLDYVGMENVESWTGKYIETDSDAEGQANIFGKGDVLFGKLRPYLAKVYHCKEKGLCSGEFLVLRSKDGITEKYLQNTLLSPHFIDLINSSTYGAKMPRANWSFIGNQEIPIPPDKEQEEIVSCINSYTAKTGQAIHHQSHEIKALKEFKNSLINAAVTGKIKV